MIGSKSEFNWITATYGVHRVQICKWKKQLLESVPSLFKRENKGEADWIKERHNLYRQIGEVAVERDWLKKTTRLGVDVKRQLIDLDDRLLTIKRQCELLELSRSTLYYVPCRDECFNLAVMRAIDEIFTQHPEYGSRRIKFELNALGICVGRDLIGKLMKRMGLEAI